jgi:hypothetical protein
LTFWKQVKSKINEKRKEGKEERKGKEMKYLGLGYLVWVFGLGIWFGYLVWLFGLVIW